MPEGPEVKTVVDNLNKTLKGSYVTKIEISEDSRYYKKWDVLPTPFQIIKVMCKGKNIFFELGGVKPICYLHSHLLMTGKWLWSKGLYTLLVFNLKDGRKLYYDDQRKIGLLNWLSEPEYKLKIKKIGKDILSEDISFEEWKTIMRNGRLKRKQICDMLISQKYISGIGNYLKAEILYRSKIRPDRVLSDLSDAELKTLHKISVDTILESYKSKGLTFSNYETPDGDKGYFKILIYNQKKDPYGNKVQRDVFKDNRTTHWVPEVQK